MDRDRRRSRIRRLDALGALTAVTVAWSLSWLGILLGASLFAVPRAVGYWVLLLSLGMVVIGTILVRVSGRADLAKEESPAS